MKQIKLTSAVILLTAIITVNTNAQGLKVTANAGYRDTGVAVAETMSKGSFKALKNFQKEYSNVDNEAWGTSGNLISATFNSGSKKVTAFYTKSGRWFRTMTIHNEGDIPQNVIRMISKSPYRDDNIKLVQEFDEPNLHMYIVHLNYNKSYKQVCIKDNNVFLLEEFMLTE